MKTKQYIQVTKSDKKNIMRVGYTAPSWPLNHVPNGIGTYVQNILKGLGDEIKPIILTGTIIDSTPRDDLIYISSSFESRSFLQKSLDKILYSLKSPHSQSLLYQRNMNYIAQDIALAIQQSGEPLDILEMEETFGVANFLIKFSKVAIVTRLHGPWFMIGPILNARDDWDFKLRVAYEKKAIENAHGVTSPSLDVLEKVRDYYGLALPQAKVIPNPVPEVSIENQWQLRSDKKPFILFVGRFDSVKGGDLMLLAFQIIAQKNKNVELLFVGPDRGLTVEGKLLKINEYIEQNIHEDAVKKRIQFLGHCDQQRISDLRKAALITVICSRYENLPLSLLEALAAGCPTVATAVGGIKEIIMDNFNGFLAAPESPESIAERALELIDDPTKMQALSKNAIEDCKRRFSPEVVAAQTIDYYKSVIARSSNS